ncbi:APC family permease [Dictyobacter arantiisoli]|uniref:Amino acid permease n=1 Tax=Dictyobacter arantiisoli TaxID=2014874 RepID=A0A5A5TDI8_9CHLR|nr:APC family permease [Dictyobacter arantiisoli]GCF08924.1 amino acid permease [Dictyobacter arantiisoli]
MSDAPSPVPGIAADPALRKGSLGLRHAIVISVAVMSPAASIFFNTIPQAGVVGGALPLCYVIGFIVALLVANQYSELARELPSSGSAYTFVQQGLNPYWGFLTGWIGLIGVALGGPYTFVLMSANLQALVLRWFGINIHWTIWFVIAVGIVFAICYIGIRQSLTIDLTLLCFEMGICVLLALLILSHVGAQRQLSLIPFTTGPIPGGGDLTIGIILAVLSFIGFETAATLGEETNHPGRNIPRAVYGSMLVVGVFYILMAYVATMGYGIQNMSTGYANDAAPFDTISRHLGGNIFALLIDLAGIFSFFGAALAIINGGARIIYSVGRDGLLPSWTARTHAINQTPIGAITLLCVFALICGIPLGLLMTPIEAFAFLGTLDALFILLIYLLVNIACIRFFQRQRRSQFNLIKHGVIPVISTILMTAIFIAAYLEPGATPLNLIPYIVTGWIAIGLVVLLIIRRKIVA